MVRALSHGRIDPIRQHQVRRALHCHRDTPTRQLNDFHRQRRLIGKGEERRPQSRLGEDHRINAMGQIAELSERRLHLITRRCKHGRRVVVAAGARRGTSEAQLVQQRQKSLLCTVVEVALETPTGLVARLDDSGL